MRANAILSVFLAAAVAAPLRAQQPKSPAPAAPAAALRSAPVTDVRYEVTFTRETARRRQAGVVMTFAVAGPAPVLLSLPAWTPGAYEITNFAKWVAGFAATQGGKELAWDKVDADTWRLRPAGAGEVRVQFDVAADSLDNAMAWSRDDFLLFNGTTLFPYPEGQPLGFAATVTIRTEPDWLVATGMTPAGPARAWREANYHDLVDMPTFVGRFDLDSADVDGLTVRLATYPGGSLAGQARQETWERLRKMFAPMIAVFGDRPFAHYTVMQIADTSYQGASGLEHQNSHVDVVTPAAVGSPFLDGLFAHEIFHAWNVKRLRPADLWPYQYDRPQPTTWLWVSEGITDYYADLTLARAGLSSPEAFYATTAGKIANVAGNPPVALEDASLSTWIHPTDGTGYLYYDKGSLAGLLLDILIRDASDNQRSLDTVMRGVYQSAYKAGRGFTADEWWKAVSAAAGGKSFADFAAKYVDGREPYPWDTVLPLAGLTLVRDVRLGLSSEPTDAGVRVVSVVPGTSAAQAGVKPGDLLRKVGDLEVNANDFGPAFRQRYADKVGQPITMVVERGGQTLTLSTTVQLGQAGRIAEDPGAGEKAVRIRQGILTGR